MKQFLVSLAMLSAAVPALAETLVVEYSSFYSHVRKIDKEETSALQFAFGFLNVRDKTLCTIKDAFINTQKQNISLTVSPEQRFTVPNEKALKMAKANVVIELEEAANLCDMSVQLETKSEFLHKQYGSDELMTLHSQYQEFFDNMGGFLSFLMPGTEGLVFHFEDTPVINNVPQGVTTDGFKVVVPESVIEAGNALVFALPPKRITALMSE